MKQRKEVRATAAAVDESEGSARDVGGSAPPADISVMANISSNMPSIPIPTAASDSDDDNSFMPVQQDGALTAGVVSHLNATIENDVEIDFARPEFQRQVSLSDAENSDHEIYHDEESQSTSCDEDELRSYSSQESYSIRPNESPRRRTAGA